MRESNSKVESFRTNIRRNARNQIFNAMRVKFNYDCSTIDEIARSMGLPPRQIPYTIKQIMIKQKQALVNPCNWLQKIKNGMQEQNQANNKQQLDKAYTHTDFWSYLVKQLYQQTLKPDQQIYQFLQDYLLNTPYKVLAAHKKYQMKVINAFQLIAYSILTPKQFKKIILAWVTGTQGLVLLSNAMISQFLDPQEYKNFYSVIILGFKLHDLSQLQTCCQLVVYCFRHADVDDLHNFYEAHSQMMVQIILKASTFVQKNNIQIFADAILTLCNSYNSVIMDYTRMGIALLGAKMINSEIESNILKGLQIINFCAEVDKIQMIQFLLKDLQLENEGLWKTLVQSPKILKSANIQYRRHGFSIIANVMAHGQSNQVIQITNNFQVVENQGMIEFLKIALQFEDDTEIVKNILSIISVLVYYGNITKQQDEQNLILKSFIDLGLHHILDKLIHSPNQRISFSAIELLQAFNYYINTSKNIEN